MTPVAQVIEKIQAQGMRTKEPYGLSGEPDQSKTRDISTTKCGKCNDAGYFYNLENNSVRFCSCRKDRVIEERLKFARIPEEFSHITVNSFNLELYSKTVKDARTGFTHYELACKAKRIAAKYVENYKYLQPKGKGLYIYYKTPGTGKTHLAVAILNALIKVHGVRGAFVVVASLLEEIKSTFDKRSEYTKSELIDAVKEVDVLVLDDIGVEEAKPFAKQELYNILNYRMIHRKMTIFTSNCSTDELEHGERIISRINSMTYPVYLAGQDNREQLARKQEDEELRQLLEG